MRLYAACNAPICDETAEVLTVFKFSFWEVAHRSKRQFQTIYLKIYLPKWKIWIIYPLNTRTVWQHVTWTVWQHVTWAVWQHMSRQFDSTPPGQSDSILSRQFDCMSKQSDSILSRQFGSMSRQFESILSRQWKSMSRPFDSTSLGQSEKILSRQFYSTSMASLTAYYLESMTACLDRLTAFHVDSHTIY